MVKLAVVRVAWMLERTPNKAEHTVTYGQDCMVVRMVPGVAMNSSPLNNWSKNCRNKRGLRGWVGGLVIMGCEDGLRWWVERVD